MARTSCPTLRSRNESGSQLVSPGSLDEPVEHHPEMGEDAASIIKCGDFFVILGDSLEAPRTSGPTCRTRRGQTSSATAQSYRSRLSDQ